MFHFVHSADLTSCAAESSTVAVVSLRVTSLAMVSSGPGPPGVDARSHLRLARSDNAFAQIVEYITGNIEGSTHDLPANS